MASSNSTFVYSANKSSFAAAEEQCNALGGHLAYYTSLEEQAEVELRFVAMGVLFPAFSPSYWLGLVTERAKWPEFRCEALRGCKMWRASELPSAAHLHLATGRQPLRNHLRSCAVPHILSCRRHLTASTRMAAGGCWRQHRSRRATTTSTGRRRPSCSRTTLLAASTAARPTSPWEATTRSPGRMRTARLCCPSSAESTVGGLELSVKAPGSGLQEAKSSTTWLAADPRFAAGPQRRRCTTTPAPATPRTS